MSKWTAVSFEVSPKDLPAVDFGSIAFQADINIHSSFYGEYKQQLLNTVTISPKWVTCFHASKKVKLGRKWKRNASRRSVSSLFLRWKMYSELEMVGLSPEFIN